MNQLCTFFKKRSFLFPAVVLLSVLSPLLGGSSVRAAASPSLYTRTRIVKIPNFDASACFDLGVTHKDILYLADATNRSVDVIAGGQRSSLGKGLFQGTAGCHAFDFSQQGPNGLVIEHGLLWAADGNATVKVFKLSTRKLLATISTGDASDMRADELDYLPELGEVVVANPDATPPYLTYIKASEASGFKIVGKQFFPEAAAGLEQPRYAHGRLYLAVPATTIHPGGELVLIDPATRTVVARHAVGNCAPNGLEVLEFVAALGCGNGPDEVLDLKHGILTMVQGSGPTDIVAIDPRRGRFFFSSFGNAAVYVTNVKGKVLQAIPTDHLAHSVTVDPENGRLFIPVGSLGGVAVYDLTGR